MLTSLSIRDIVLIEKLDLSFDKGLTVLSGETGAGKSILLDSLGLTLGARGDADLVRSGQAKGSVTAGFTLPPTHAAHRLLSTNEVDAEGEIVVRRIQSAEGASRASVNDQAVSLNLLRQLAVQLIELHGQHADRALVDVAAHRALIDAFGGHDEAVAGVGNAWEAVSAARTTRDEHAALLAKAEADRDYIVHALAELDKLSPEPQEEQRLAADRQLMMQSEQFVAALDEADDALTSDGAIEVKLNAALRRLERRKEGAGGRLDEVCAALDRAIAELAESGRAIAATRRAFVFDPKHLDKSEERLFALRAAARKHKCTVDGLAELQQRFATELQAISDGGSRLSALEEALKVALSKYEGLVDKLSAARKKTAAALDKAVLAELPALKLEKARFETRIDTDASKPGAHGIDRVEFVVAANPGTPLQPLMKVASGGELARFMLALKVILAAKGSAPVLIFDEIDTGVGGAVADAIGQRLSRLAKNLQVICVTHSPQVAARADHHFLISKMEDVGSKRMVTRVQPLSAQSRREELARMLSGATVTDEARAQAERLLAGQG
jgi:DNA repair protein RecN (Recombination protein N)